MKLPRGVATAVVVMMLLTSCGGDSEEPGGTSAAVESPVECEEPTADATDDVDETESAEPSPTPTPTRTKKPKPKPPRTYLVTRVVDGDTLELGNGETVRMLGIDTPERGKCGFDRANANLERIVLGERVRLTTGGGEDRDGYDRLLRYVNIGTMDAGLRLIKNGLAIARYDSRDGYGPHPRENLYTATDKARKNFRCPKPPPAPPPPPSSGGSGCADGYTPCIPPYPPDVNCDDVNGPISVTGSDPHGLDRDGDGVACES